MFLVFLFFIILLKEFDDESSTAPLLPESSNGYDSSSPTKENDFLRLGTFRLEEVICQLQFFHLLTDTFKMLCFLYTL